MRYKNLDLKSREIISKSHGIESGEHDRFYKLETLGYLLVSDSLTKLKWLKELGLTTTPIYDAMSTSWVGKKRYAVGVVLLDEHNQSSLDDDFIVEEQLNYWRDSLDTVDNVRGYKKTVRHFCELYENDNNGSMRQLCAFLRKHYKSTQYIGIDFNSGYNMLVCPITGYVYPYDCINFAWMDNHEVW